MGDSAAAIRTVVRIVAVVVIAVALLWLAYQLRTVLGWIVVAAFVAIVASAPVGALAPRVGRPLAIGIVYGAAFAVPVGLVLLLAPTAVEQADALVDALPGYVRDVQEWADGNDTLRRLDDEYELFARLQELVAGLPARIDTAAGLLSTAFVRLLDAAVAFVAITVMSIMLLQSGGRWAGAALTFVAPPHRERVARILRDVRRATIAYVRAQLTIALIAAVAGYLVMTLLGIPFREPLALVIAFGSLLPLFGSFLWGATIALVTLFQDFPTTTLLWLVWAIAYPQFENNVLQPLIQRQAVDVAPIVVLVAVLFGGTLFGVAGVLLSIPTAAALQIALREWWAWRRELAAAPLTEGVGSGRPPARGVPAGDPD